MSMARRVFAGVALVMLFVAGCFVLFQSRQHGGAGAGGGRLELRDVQQLRGRRRLDGPVAPAAADGAASDAVGVVGVASAPNATASGVEDAADAGTADAPPAAGAASASRPATNTSAAANPVDTAPPSLDPRGPAVDGSSGWKPWLSPESCFPDVDTAAMVVPRLHGRLTFPQLRFAVTGRCPAPLPPAAEKLMQDWLQLQQDMFDGKVPFKGVQWECSQVCGGHADRLKVCRCRRRAVPVKRVSCGHSRVGGRA